MPTHNHNNCRIFNKKAFRFFDFLDDVTEKLKSNGIFPKKINYTSNVHCFNIISNNHNMIYYTLQYNIISAN